MTKVALVEELSKFPCSLPPPSQPAVCVSEKFPREYSPECTAVQCAVHVYSVYSAGWAGGDSLTVSSMLCPLESAAEV